MQTSHNLYNEMSYQIQVEKKVFQKLQKSVEDFLRRGVDFTSMFMLSFYTCKSQKRKKTVKSSVSFCAFGIYLLKCCL